MKRRKRQTRMKEEKDRHNETRRRQTRMKEEEHIQE